jgi:predicted DNA-binding transcriptional regulator YafY
LDIGTPEARAQETRRIARLLDIIWRISAAPNQWTRKRLAEAFEVSERMISSDLQIIRHRFRWDLQNDRGRGYYFVSVPKLPSVSYSMPEALALILAAQSGRQFGGIPQHDLSAAIARLTSVIPSDLRVMVERFISASEVESDDHRAKMLATLSHAVATSRPVEIVYAAASSDGAETRRRVDPYAVFPYDRSWLAIGYCHLREDVRMFKIDRIQSAVEMPGTFTALDGFDLSAFLASGWGIMRGLDLPVEQVELRFRLPAARWVAEERWHASQDIVWNDDGTMTFTVQIQVTPEFERWVFQYGRDVDVVTPASLRAWVAAEARTVFEQAGVAT